MKDKLKKLLKKKLILNNKIYYIILMLIPVLGMIIKNTLLQGYLLGENLYSPDILQAISQSWKFWMIYVAMVVIFVFIGFLFKSDKVRLSYIFTCNFFFTVLICCDIIYSRSFFTMPSAADALILKNFSGFEGGEVSSLLCGYDTFIFLDIIVFILFILFVRKKDKENKPIHIKKLRKYALSLGGIALLVIICIPLQAKAMKIDVNSENKEDENMYLSSVGFHIKDIYELIRDTFKTELSDDDKEMITEYYQWKNEDLPDNQYAGIFEGKNVLFLQIESLESFVINETIDGQEITPNINRLLENGILFKNIVEQVQGGNSSDADLMYTTSRLPVTKGSTFFRFAEDQIASFPNYLEELGYNMLYTQAIKGSFWNYKMGWKNIIGVDAFKGAEDINMDHEKIGFTINDKDFIDETYKYISDLTGPYYAHIVLNSSHMPFILKDELKELDLKEDLDATYLGGYLQCVKYVDTQIGELLDRMESDGLLENTVIVIIGDHTGLNKYYDYSVKEWYDEYPFVDIHGMNTVPLIICSSDFSETYQSDIIGGQVDVMPTLAYLFGEDKEEYINTAMGRNLMNTERSYAIYRDGTIFGDISESDKKIVMNSYKVSEKLFNTQSEYIDIISNK